MDAAKLTALISLILALSIASERLVEIVKGFFPFLDKAVPEHPTREGIRRSLLQLLAVAAGVITAFMSSDYIPAELAKPTASWQILGLGLLASGGSGFWNSILTYVAKVKDLKKLELEEKKK
jgi:O-antigen/teichoic acid export membrane protein